VFGPEGMSWQAGVCFRNAVQIADFIILGSGATALGPVVVRNGEGPHETRERTPLYPYTTVLYSTVLYCTALHCTVLYCAALHCNVLCTHPELAVGSTPVPPHTAP